MMLTNLLRMFAWLPPGMRVLVSFPIVLYVLLSAWRLCAAVIGIVRAVF